MYTNTWTILWLSFLAYVIGCFNYLKIKNSYEKILYFNF
ncbi:putative membrane protein (plasmid) [Acinetobacter baumannii]|nr:putative membrane protein [Acinetobacter baumannii]